MHDLHTNFTLEDSNIKIYRSSFCAMRLPHILLANISSRRPFLCQHHKNFSLLPRSVHNQDWVGLHLFNDDTRPSGHISHPTQVDVFRCCFHSLNRLIKPDYIVQVWGLFEVKIIASVGGWFKWGIVLRVWSFKSDRRILLLAGILLCKSWELSQRESCFISH